MTKTLTEQWREGTLLTGCYYVLSTEDDTPVACDIDTVCDFMIRDVVEPVPSYDEYKQLVSNSDKLDKIMSDSATNQGDCQQIVEDNLRREISQLEKQLEIAINALKQYSKGDNWLDAGCRGQVFLPTKRGYSIADKALDEMEP